MNSQFVILDKSGPILIKRLASIRKFPRRNEKICTINADKIINQKLKVNQNYHPLSKLDLKVLLREINQST